MNAEGLLWEAQFQTSRGLLVPRVGKDSRRGSLSSISQPSSPTMRTIIASRRRLAKGTIPYQGTIYRGSLYLTWARLFVGTQFTYATLSMAAGYILCALEEAASDLIQELVPHRYVPGKNHGNVEGECYRWDRRLDAGGQETLLDELQHRTWAYTHERYENLLSAWDRHGKGGVYLVDVSEPSEKNIHFVFSDTRALGAVRFRFIMKDCRAIERPMDELNRAVEQEKADVISFVRKEHDELERTFDPSVCPFAQATKDPRSQGCIRRYRVTLRGAKSVFVLPVVCGRREKMEPRTRALRRHFRRVKALRRLRADRNQHYRDLACLCWGTRVHASANP